MWCVIGVIRFASLWELNSSINKKVGGLRGLAPLWGLRGLASLWGLRGLAPLWGLRGLASLFSIDIISLQLM